MVHAETKRNNMPLKLWAACVFLVLAPSLLAWLLRAAALVARCAPGPQLCLGIALGAGLREALLFAWLVGANSFLVVLLAVVAALAALLARRPLLAALTLLVLPVVMLMLPTAAVYSALYPDCSVSESGIGDCALWGAQMGMSFHAAADVPWQIYGFVPYTFALALMLGLLGWFLARPKTVTAQAQRRRDQEFRPRDGRYQ